MSSVVPGFEYDIFISYRHNDNLDGWVTDFVQNLEKELKGTLKDTVTIYFDKNPHDGLLETHSVDKSLEGKLKCLIFIPIISQTYCDQKSFAWQYEFCAFNKLSKEDQFGRDIKLSNGNVASRVLPVKIHDLDSEDSILLENELGGVLRAIDFIFKSTGVNRPLRAIEDHPNDNQNKTFYRDQVNKVANAVKEIISSLKNPAIQSKQAVKIEKSNANDIRHKKSLVPVIAVLLLLSALGYFIYLKIVPTVGATKYDKSIAVLPFKNLNADAQNQYFADGVMGEIINHLAKIKAIRVVSSTSVEQYRNNRKPANQISEELGVTYLLDGTAQQIAERIKVSVQLIDAKRDQQLWSETFESHNDDIFLIQSEVAEKIAKELKAQITPQEKELLREIPTSSAKAYDYYLRGKEYNSRFLHNNDTKDFANTITLQKQAIALDSNFANAYANIGLTYCWAELNYSNPIKVDFLALGSRKYGDSVYHYANKALELNPNLPEAFSLMGWYYGMGNHIDRAEVNFQKAIEIGYLQENKGLGLFNMVRGDYEQAYKNWAETYLFMGTNLLPIDYTDAGLLYMHIGDLEKAEFYQRESIRLQPDFKWGFRNMVYLLSIQGRFEEAYSYSKQLLSFSEAFDDYLNMSHLLGLMKKFDEADKYLREGLSRMSSEYGDNELEGAYIFWMTNRKDEARKRFKMRIDFCERAISERTTYAYKRAAYELASIHSFLGNEKEGYRWLNEYAAMGFREGLENYIEVDPLFEPLRNQSEFQKIVEKARSRKAEIQKRFRILEKEAKLIER